MGTPDTQMPRPQELGLQRGTRVDTSLPVSRRTLVFGGLGTIGSALLLAACGGTEPKPIPTSAITTPRPDQTSTLPTAEPTHKPSLQVPLDQWRLEISDTDPSLPAQLAHGVLITSFTAVNAGRRRYPDTSRVSSGDPVKDIILTEPFPNAFSDIQISAAMNATPEEMEKLDDSGLWVYGGRFGADDRYAIQNDSNRPCAPVQNRFDCPSTYTSKYAGIGNEEGPLRYFVFSAPLALNKTLGAMARSRTTIELGELPHEAAIHDYIEIYRQPTPTKRKK